MTNAVVETVSGVVFMIRSIPVKVKYLGAPCAVA